MTWSIDEEGRLSEDLGEIHPGTTTRLVIGDDGIVRGVTVAKPQPEETPTQPANQTWNSASENQ